MRRRTLICVRDIRRGRIRLSLYPEYKFTNQIRDPNGIDHFWMRSYSATLGRWLTPDSAGLAAVDPSNPQSWNRYAYVLNNPASLIDPLGLDDVAPDGSSSNFGQPGTLFTVNVWASSGGSDFFSGSGAAQQLNALYFDGLEEIGTSGAGGPVGGGSSSAASHPINCNDKVLVPLASGLKYTSGSPNLKPYFDPMFAMILDQAIASLNAQNIVPQINSAFRTSNDQVRMRNGGSGSRPAAALSLHQAGLAVDIQVTPSITMLLRSAFPELTWGGAFSHVDRVHWELNVFGSPKDSRYKRKLQSAAARASAYYTKCIH